MTSELAYCTSKYHYKMVRDTIAPGGNVIKLFPLSMMTTPNKLERLSQGTVLEIVTRGKWSSLFGFIVSEKDFMTLTPRAVL
jgi:hypothetical protein